MLKKILLAIIPMGFLATTAIAGEWSLSLNPSYRSFDDVQINRRAFSNPKYTPSADTANSSFVNGWFTGAGGSVRVDNPATQVDPAVTFATLDAINITSGNADLDNSFALTVAAQRILSSKDAWTLSLDMGLTFVSSDMSETINGVVSSTVFQLPGGIVPIPMADGSTIYGAGVQETPIAGIATTTGKAKFELDLNAYTFNLGLAAKYQINRFRLAVAFGPALTIATSDVDVLETVTLAGGGNVYTKKESDSSTDFLWGLYISAGVEYNFSETFALGLEYRYDYMINDLSTDYLDADLSGSSGVLKFIYKF